MPKLKFSCHLYTWQSLTDMHLAPVFRQAAEAGYDGVEGLGFQSAEDFVEATACARSWNLDMVNARGRTPSQCIRYNAVLGNRFAEVWEGMPDDFGPEGTTHEEHFPMAAKYFEPIMAEAEQYGIQLGHHIHMGQLLVTNDDLDLMHQYIPKLGILFDTGHLAAAGGDNLRVIREYPEKIKHVHLKDFHRAEGWDPEKPDWTTSHFERIGYGNVGLDFKAILGGLEQIGYEGWVSIELDPQKPLMDKGIRIVDMMRQSREFLASIGY